jgi:regulator of protease activity HflC (stomatin/prohibitin superfamily)
MSFNTLAAASGRPGARVLKWAVGALVVLFALFVFLPFAVVPNGHRGIRLTFGSASDEVLAEGLHWRTPIMQTVYKMPVLIERSETESEAASRDLQRVRTQVVLNYHVDPKQVVRVYRTIGAFENIEPRIIDPTVQEAMKAVTALFTAEQLVTKRPEVSDRIRLAVNTRLQRHGIVVDEFAITNFKFSESFDTAIEAKTVAEQQKLKAERDLARIQVEAEQKVAEARGMAESQKLNAEAQAVALQAQRAAVTPELIELRRVEAQLEAIKRWDGRLPAVTGGSTPLLNLDAETLRRGGVAP